MNETKEKEPKDFSFNEMRNVMRKMKRMIIKDFIKFNDGSFYKMKLTSYQKSLLSYISEFQTINDQDLNEKLALIIMHLISPIRLAKAQKENLQVKSSDLTSELEEVSDIFRSFSHSKLHNCSLRAQILHLIERLVSRFETRERQCLRYINGKCQF